MHEYAIAESIVDQASQAALQVGVQRIVRVVCRIGALRQIQDELLREAFEHARVDTLCESATLEIQKTDLTADCPACQKDFPVRNWDYHCPGCGAEGGHFRGGDELEVVSIDVEDSRERPRDPSGAGEERPRSRPEPQSV